MRTDGLWSIGVRLASLAVIAIVGLAATGVSSATAEGGPSILLLEKGLKSLEAVFTGGESTLETLSGKVAMFLGAELRWRSCEPLAGSEERDTASCKDAPIEFKGGKCRTEGSEAGVVSFLLDLHLAAEKSASQVLEPLLLSKFLSKELQPEVRILCGFVAIGLKGTLACLLLPGLRNVTVGEEVELTCKIETSLHDPETGACEVLCELLEEPFEAEILSGFTDAWMTITMKGKFNKDIFIDD